MNIFKQIKNLATDTSKSFGPLEDWYITAERAEGIKDKDLFSKSDPYLKINFGGKHVKTRTINNDRTPAWNETFHFQLSSGSSKNIHLTLMDSDIGLDDTIGTATISKADLPLNSGEDKYLKVPVYRKEQISGIVHLRIKKVSPNSSISSNVSSTYPQSQVSSTYPQSQVSSQSSQYPNLSYQQQQQQPHYNSSNQYQQPYNTSSNYNMPPPPPTYNQPQYNQPYNQQPYNQQYNQSYNQPSYNQQPNQQPYNSQPYNPQSYNQQSYSQQPYNQSYNAPPQSYNAPYNSHQGSYQSPPGPMNQPQQHQPYMNTQQNYYPPNNYGNQYQQRRY